MVNTTNNTNSNTITANSLLLSLVKNKLDSVNTKIDEANALLTKINNEKYSPEQHALYMKIVDNTLSLYAEKDELNEAALEIKITGIKLDANEEMLEDPNHRGHVCSECLERKESLYKERVELLARQCAAYETYNKLNK